MKLFAFLLLALPCMASLVRGRGGRHARDRFLQDFTTDCTCAENCGGQVPECGCWCDAVCESFGDCCDDVADTCEDIDQAPFPSPVDDFGPTASPYPTMTFDDEYADDYIGLPVVDDEGAFDDSCTCSGLCGATTPTECGCWCDAPCASFQDCCSDVSEVCTF